MKKLLLFAFALTACFCKAQGTENLFDLIQKQMDQMKKEFSDIKSQMDVMSEKMELELPKVESGYSQDKKTYFLKVQLPGFDEKDIEIKAKSTDAEKFIMISVEKKSQKEEVTKQKTFEKKEFKAGSRSFETSQSLPQDAIIEEIKWSYKDGILEITIPVKQQPGDNIISIKTRG